MITKYSQSVQRVLAGCHQMTDVVSSCQFVYLNTKFRYDSLIHGCVITSSDVRKRTSAILELYFRFGFDLLIVTDIGILL